MFSKYFGAFIFVLSAAVGSALYAVDPTDGKSREISRSDRKLIAASTYGFTGNALSQRFQFPADASDGNFGIDVSHFNGDINWQNMAADGVKFVYIKATQGKDIVDAKFEANWTGAKAAGLKVGAYHFLSSLDPAEEQVTNFLNTYQKLGVEKGGDADLPAVLDVEWDFSTAAADGHQTDRWATHSASSIASTVEAWLAAVEKTTKKSPLIYTNTTWWTQRVGASGDDLAKTYKLWISDYTLSNLQSDTPVAPQGFEVDLWQFTDRGGVKGLIGPVDVNKDLNLQMN
ncbi:GH25 family lysozyme [uncultured Roseovarius sp.]|uniref:glycoside hydrolase family 25 protein n=1 Tax=uncultured Roseovarius sp. TaxID=293344 RepID=UPI00262C731F|nr:GH25 family lysozyme [uncultured Roseovarius sp.]